MRILTLALSLFLLSCGNTAKVAYYNGDLAWQDHPITVKIDSALKDFSKQLDVRQREFQAKMLDAKLQADSAKDKAVKDSMNKEVFNLQTLLADYDRFKQLEYERKVDELEGPILKQVDSILAKIAKDEGYSLIVNRTRLTARIVPYAGSIDITPEVKKQIAKIN